MSPDELQQRMDAVAELTTQGREYLFGCLIAGADRYDWQHWLKSAQHHSCPGEPMCEVPASLHPEGCVAEPA